MGRVLTECTTIAVTRESALGVPGTSWLKVQPDGLTNWGAKYKEEARNPIQKNRTPERPVVVDIDSAPGLAMDLTMEHANEFIDGFAFAARNGASRFVPTAVTSTGYTVASGGDLAIYTLVEVKGLPLAANNGLKVLVTGSTATEIKCSGLTADASVAAAENASVEVCGYQGQSGDIVMTAGGNLTSTLLDFTTLPLYVGMRIKIGGYAAATKFATAANNGFARISVIAAGQLTLEHRSFTPASDVGAAKTIQILYGQFLANRTPDHASFSERSYTIEAGWENLGDSAGTDEFEYAYGNYCNELALAMPTSGKVTMSAGFVGTDTTVPVVAGSRLSGADSARVAVSKRGFNSANDVARLRLSATDESGDTTYFENLNFKINNGVTGQRVMGTRGASFMNYDKFMCTLDGTMLFTSSDVLTAIRNKTDMAFSFCLQCDDGGIFFDLPSVTLSDGGRDLPRGKAVTCSLAMEAHEDAVLGWALGVTFFPYLPGASR